MTLILNKSYISALTNSEKKAAISIIWCYPIVPGCLHCTCALDSAVISSFPATAAMHTLDVSVTA